MKKLNPNLLYESIGGIDETLFAECEGENAAATAVSNPRRKLLRGAHLRALAGCRRLSLRCRGRHRRAALFPEGRRFVPGRRFPRHHTGERKRPRRGSLP